MQDKQFPVLLKGSRYAERLPIGKTEVIQNFKPERLKKFYADWYRPDLMAVVAVGDFDKAAVEALIKTHFASIPAATTPKPRPTYDVPDHPGTLYAIVDRQGSADDAASRSTRCCRRGPTARSARYRQQIVERLFSGMLSARFAEMAQKPDAPFLGAVAGRGRFVAHARTARR